MLLLGIPEFFLPTFFGRVLLAMVCQILDQVTDYHSLYEELVSLSPTKQLREELFKKRRYLTGSND